MLGTGAAVRHVDEGELDAALMFAVSDLAETRITVKAFVLDDRIMMKGRLAVFADGFHNGVSDARFTGGKLGIIGRTAEVGLVALRVMRRLDRSGGKTMAGARLAIATIR